MGRGRTRVARRTADSTYHGAVRAVLRSLVLAAALVGVLLTGTALAAPSVTLAPVVSAAPSHGGGAPVVIRVTIANPRAVPVRVPRADLAPAAFAVTRNGAPVRYTGPIAKTVVPLRADGLLIPARGSRTIAIDLSHAFAFTRTATYVIALQRSSGLAVEPIEVRVTGRPIWMPPVAPVTARTRIGAQSVSFTGCIGSEPTLSTTAIADAHAYAVSSLQYFTDRRAGARYVHWFGTYDAARWAAVRDHYTAAEAALASAAITIICHDPDCNPGTYAFVYPPSPYNVYVCDAFWTAPATGTDSKAGTLIHEFMHFNVVAGTDDWVYGQSGAASLAISNPGHAVANSDNHEYFSENNAPIADNAAAVTVSTATADFGSVAVGSASAPLTVTVTNTGDIGLTMGAIAPSAPFATANDACSNRILAASAVCTFQLVFAPTAAGASSASITVPTDAVIAAPAIAATGTAPAVVTEAPAPVAQTAPAAVTTRAGRGSLTLTAAAGKTVLVQVRRHGRWVVARTIAMQPGTTTIRLKHGTYRVITDPKGTAIVSKAIVVR